MEVEKIFRRIKATNRLIIIIVSQPKFDILTNTISASKQFNFYIIFADRSEFILLVPAKLQTNHFGVCTRVFSCHLVSTRHQIKRAMRKC